MLRTKTLLLTVAVVALAVPSLWAQRNFKNKSVEQIKQILQKEADTAGVPSSCAALVLGTAPGNYFASTNKCSSGNVNYTSTNGNNSIQAFVGHCSDSSGVEATYDAPLLVDAISTGGGTWPVPWHGGFAPQSTENSNPDIYRVSTTAASEIGLTLKNKQSLFGLEVDNITEQTYTVTFHTTVGDQITGGLVGGAVEPSPLGQRAVAICSGPPAITGVTVQCDTCTEVNGLGETAVAQIRGSNFKGF